MTGRHSDAPRHPDARDCRWRRHRRATLAPARAPPRRRPRRASGRQSPRHTELDLLGRPDRRDAGPCQRPVGIAGAGRQRRTITCCPLAAAAVDLGLRDAQRAPSRSAVRSAPPTRRVPRRMDHAVGHRDGGLGPHGRPDRRPRPTPPPRAAGPTAAAPLGRRHGVPEPAPASATPSTPSTTPTPAQPDADAHASSTPSPSAGTPRAPASGVPAGTALTVHDGDLTVTEAGTVVDSMDIHGYLRIKAAERHGEEHDRARRRRA